MGYGWISGVLRMELRGRVDGIMDGIAAVTAGADGWNATEIAEGIRGSRGRTHGRNREGIRRMSWVEQRAFASGLVSLQNRRFRAGNLNEGCSIR